jgi:hypothetical protein
MRTSGSTKSPGAILNVAGTAAPRPLLEVRCEALVQQPEAVCRKLLGFVGLPWDPRCLDFHQPGNSRVM